MEGRGVHLPQLIELLQGAIYRNPYREGGTAYTCPPAPNGYRLCVRLGTVYVWKTELFRRSLSRVEAPPNVGRTGPQENSTTDLLYTGTGIQDEDLTDRAEGFRF